jgi:glycosyltransferase involved in cell wall biosynthesis
MFRENKPDKSIIVCTVNRPHQLKECVDALIAQDGILEIIVVDQSESPYPVFEDDRVVHVPCERKGLSCARNVGFSHSVGQIISFVDDDSVPGNSFVSSLHRIFQDSNVDAVAGRVLVQGTSLPYARTQGDNSRILKISDWDVMLGGNIAFRRSTIAEGGLFDERFGAGTEWSSAEETDYFFRLCYLNKKVLYSPDLIVFHPLELNGHSDRSLANKLFFYGKGTGALFAKHYFDYRVKKKIFSFLWSLIKPVMMMLLCILQRDSARFRLYKSILDGRIKGFKEFRILRGVTS